MIVNRLIVKGSEKVTGLESETDKDERMLRDERIPIMYSNRFLKMEILYYCVSADARQAASERLYESDITQGETGEKIVNEKTSTCMELLPNCLKS